MPVNGIAPSITLSNVSYLRNIFNVCRISNAIQIVTIFWNSFFRNAQLSHLNHINLENKNVLNVHYRIIHFFFISNDCTAICAEMYNTIPFFSVLYTHRFYHLPSLTNIYSSCANILLDLAAFWNHCY